MSQNWEHLTRAISDLEEPELLQIIDEFLATNPETQEVQEVVKACQNGMAQVGDRFEAGEYFVGDLIFAGEILQESIEKLKPALGGGESKVVGKMVLGTVHGDLHDIGKNIFRSMVEAAGFEVHDIGIDAPVETFVEKVKEVKPDVVGMSGVLTLAIDAMKDTVDGLIKAGLRDNLKIIIGGNPVNKEACELIGADNFTTNAAEGVKICQGWVAM